MELEKAKITIKVENDVFDAYKAISGEFELCGKAAQFPERTMKLSDCSFRCVYEGIVRATNNEIRYPSKSGKEYISLIKLMEIMKIEHHKQRGKNFYL